MRKSIAGLAFMGCALAAIGAFFVFDRNPLPSVALALLGFYLAAAIQVAAEWERAVLLRGGRFKELKGPGIFMIIPVVDTIVYYIDQRVVTTPFSAEQTLTRDGVPINVDAVLFWQVKDATRAALEVEDYRKAVQWAAQTALREVIGKTPHEIVLSSREQLDHELQQIIERRAVAWGIKVMSVEIRDIIIPEGLQDAMSMQAQAGRELQARVILGDSEVQIAEKFNEAAKTYASNPTALHLRAMNMLYEGLKEKGALVIVPSTAVETMNLGALTGLTALAGAKPPTK
ncbi:MAG TPA: slipin family protein [Planctomycetota bacterium]|jgi:regulator of protease activity HflC (stomatin/prohibitin superfamily)